MSEDKYPPVTLTEAMDPEYRWVRKEDNIGIDKKNDIVRFSLENKPLPRVLNVKYDDEVVLYDTGHPTGRTKLKRKAFSQDKSAMDWIRKNFRNIKIK